MGALPNTLSVGVASMREMVLHPILGLTCREDVAGLLLACWRFVAARARLACTHHMTPQLRSGQRACRNGMRVRVWKCGVMFLADFDRCCDVCDMFRREGRDD
eukprot:7384158-Prymnesium_polylepis.2